jgi:hypothetical protein
VTLGGNLTQTRDCGHAQRWFGTKLLFTPQFTFEPPRVLLPKPWSRLRPALDFLKLEHLLSPQCEVTIDLMILTVVLNGRPRSISWKPTVQIYLSQIDDCDRFRILDFENSQISNFVFLRREIFQSGRSLTPVPFNQ